MTHEPLPLPIEEKLLLQTQLLDEVRQAILAIDLTGRIVFWNRFAETLYGWSWTEVQNRDITEILATPNMVESLRENFDRLERGEVWSGDYLVQRRDGTSFVTHVSASHIQSEQNTLIRIAGVSYDSAEHQQLREANRLLAEAAALLINAVDFETPLTTLAKLAVPQLADWCAVHLLQSDGSIEQVALAPAEMTKVKAAYDWLQNHLPWTRLMDCPLSCAAACLSWSPMSALTPGRLRPRSNPT
jgi:PAS domain S-box-containing protein